MSSRVGLQIAYGFALAATLSGAILMAVLLDAYATALVLLVAALLCALALWLETRRPSVELDYLLTAMRGGTLNTRTDSQSLNVKDEIDRALNSLNERFFRADLEAARLKAIVEHVPSPLIELTDRGTVRALNDAARRALPPVSTLEGLIEEDEKLGRAIEKMRPGPPVLLRTGRELGGKRWLLTARSLRTAGEESVIISMQDVDNALMRTEFDAWRDLIRVVNHEIINALTPISSLAQSSQRIAEALPDDADGAASLREVTGTLQERARALREFIHNYRDMSRLPSPRPEVVQLDAMIGALVHELDDRGGDVRFELATVDGPVSASVDPSLVQQAVLNLLVNAADATRDAGSAAPVRVAVREEGASEDPQVVVEVRDRGAGVPEHAAEQLFVPFFTTKARGNGIGLSLVRQICLAHRGVVEWENRDGAIFRLRLPRGELGGHET